MSTSTGINKILRKNSAEKFLITNCGSDLKMFKCSRSLRGFRPTGRRRKYGDRRRLIKTWSHDSERFCGNGTQLHTTKSPRKYLSTVQSYDKWKSQRWWHFVPSAVSTQGSFVVPGSTFPSSSPRYCLEKATPALRPASRHKFKIMQVMHSFCLPLHTKRRGRMVGKDESR